MKLVVDASYMLHRAKFVAEKAQPTEWHDIASIFTTTLLKIVEENKPTQVYTLFDDGRSEHRRTLLPEYKAQRDVNKDPDDPSYQNFMTARDFLVENMRRLGFVSVLETGVEADDFAYLIASEPYSEGVLVTEDKDWYLSIFEDWSIYRPRSKQTITYRDLVELTEYPQNPRRAFLIAKAMMGDPSDNIPGLPGIGEKTAKQMAIKLLDESPLGESKREQSIIENYDMLDRNMAVMNPEWVRTCPKAKQALYQAEMATPSITKPLPRWLTFCKEFPKGQVRLNLMGWVERYNTIIRHLAL